MNSNLEFDAVLKFADLFSLEELESGIPNFVSFFKLENFESGVNKIWRAFKHLINLNLEQFKIKWDIKL